jgi:hypothetical protein
MNPHRTQVIPTPDDALGRAMAFDDRALAS